MPTISLFYGIVIRMYLGAKEHNPPHVHAYYGNCSAVFDILEAERIEGDMPLRQRRMIEAWIEIHREDLLADWDLAATGEAPLRIEPLR
jgi:hypothetical protein